MSSVSGSDEIENEMDQPVPVSNGDGSMEPQSEIDLEDYDEELEGTSAEELERAKEECRTNKHVKPPYSYIALITMAVLQVRV